MKCCIEGCLGTANPKTFDLCDGHWQRWGYYRSGYDAGYEDKHKLKPGSSRTSEARWSRAMESFKYMCKCEIIGCQEFLKAYEEIKGGNGCSR